MTKPWVDMTLRAAGVSLHDCLHKTPKDAGVGYPYISIPQMRSGRLMLSAARRITHADLIEWTKKACPQHNDVVLSRRCNPGETAWVEPGMEFALGQNLVLLRSDGTHVHPDFLRWLSRSPAWWDQVQRFINVGAVFESLRCADVPNFELPIPPLPEQRAIASILGALDDKIDLNRRMNETLEAMARAIFKSWFVDFDPVRAKAEGKQPFGMDADTAALFPDRLVDSEIGPIPEGWEVTTVGELVRHDKTSLKPEDEPETLYLHYSIPAFDSGQNPTLDRGDSIKSSKFIVPEDGVLVSKLNPRIPRVWLPDPPGDHQAICSTELLVLRPHDLQNRMLIYVLFNQSSTRERLTEYAAGTSGSHQRVKPNDILGIQLAFDARTANKIADELNSIGGLLLTNRSESRTLAELRDLLLPKLLSGEIRVKDAEKAVEVAV